MTFLLKCKAKAAVFFNWIDPPGDAAAQVAKATVTA